jgi:hypothetical protein
LAAAFFAGFAAFLAGAFLAAAGLAAVFFAVFAAGLAAVFAAGFFAVAMCVVSFQNLSLIQDIETQLLLYPGFISIRYVVI